MSTCGRALDKAVVKKVRNKIIRLLDASCTECFTRTNNYKLHGQIEAYKYCNERCSVGSKLQELGKSIGDEGNPIWTNDEVNYLLNHHQLYSIEHLSERLERSPEAVEIKLKRLLNKKSRAGKVQHANAI